jgi:predicted methyltransferase
MNRLAFAVSALAASFLSSAPAAFAQAMPQQTCAPRAELVSKLGQQFKESQQAVGIVNDHAVMELFISGKGTWTLIASGTDGTSCVVSAGTDWDSANFVKGLDTKLRHPATAPVPDRAD